MALLRVSLKNDRGEMRRVNSALADFLGEAGFSPRHINRVRLVVEELVVNIITHAFAEGSPHTIALTLRSDPRHVMVETEDDGKPFDPRGAAPPPLGRPIEEQGNGGYGIYIVKRMTQSLDYERVDGKNRTRAVVADETQEAP